MGKSKKNNHSKKSSNNNNNKSKNNKNKNNHHDLLSHNSSSGTPVTEHSHHALSAASSDELSNYSMMETTETDDHTENLMTPTESHMNNNNNHNNHNNHFNSTNNNDNNSNTTEQEQHLEKMISLSTLVQHDSSRICVTLSPNTPTTTSTTITVIEEETSIVIEEATTTTTETTTPTTTTTIEENVPIDEVEVEAVVSEEQQQPSTSTITAVEEETTTEIAANEEKTKELRVTFAELPEDSETVLVSIVEVAATTTDEETSTTEVVDIVEQETVILSSTSTEEHVSLVDDDVVTEEVEDHKDDSSIDNQDQDQDQQHQQQQVVEEEEINAQDLDFLNVYESFYIAQDNKEYLMKEKRYEQEIHKRKAATNPYLKSAVHAYKEPFQVIRKIESRYNCVPYRGALFQSQGLSSPLNVLLRRPVPTLPLNGQSTGTGNEEEDVMFEEVFDAANSNTDGVNMALSSLMNVEAQSVLAEDLSEMGGDRHSFSVAVSPVVGTASPTVEYQYSLPLDSVSPTSSTTSLAPPSPRVLSSSPDSPSVANSAQYRMSMRSPNTRTSSTLFEKLMGEEKRSSNRLKLGRTRTVFSKKSPVHSNSALNMSLNDSTDVPEDKMHEQTSILSKTKQLCSEKTTEQLEAIAKNNTILGRNEDFDTNFKPTKRLLSVFNQTYRWTPLEQAKCFRNKNPYFPIRRKTKFIVEPKSLSFDFGIPEPLFCRIALYDLKQQVKISEDFHFHLNSAESLSVLSDALQRELESAVSKCLMTVTYPSTDIYVILFVDRVLTGAYEDVLKPYLKDTGDKNRAKAIELNNQNIDVFERFRQPFVWGAAPIFEASDAQQTISLRKDMIEVKPFYKVEGDAKDMFNIFEIISNIRAGKTKTIINGNAQFQLNIISATHARMVPPVSRLQLSSSLDCDTSTNLSSPRPSRDEVTDDTGSYHEKGSSFTMNSNSPTDGFNDLTHKERRSTVSEDNSEFIENDSEPSTPTTVPIIEELPFHHTKYPHTSVKNILFVKPICAKLAIGKAKNIAVQVLLKDEDSNAETLVGKPFICGKYGNKMVDYALLGVTYGEKSPQFFDEIKIELPVPFHPKHHLLFIFYELQTEKKAAKVKQAKGGDTDQERFGKASKVVIGYSFLPLVASENISDGTVPYLIDSGEYKIGVYKTLSSLYLGNDKLEDHGSKVNLTVELKTKSTIYPPDEVMKRVFHYTSQIQQTYENKRENIDSLILALSEIGHCRFNILMPYLPMIFDLFLDILSTAFAISNDLLLAQRIEKLVFDAIMIILRQVYLMTETARERGVPTTQDTRKNKFLSSFVSHIFENNKESLPIYVPLIRILSEGLVRNQDGGSLGDVLDSPNINNKPIEKAKKSRFATIRKKQFKEMTPTSTAKSFSERDIIRFCWFFFDIIIKSMVMNRKHEIETDSELAQRLESLPKHRVDANGWTSPDENPNTEGTYSHFVMNARCVIRELVKSIVRVLNSPSGQHTYIGLSGNRSLALFICDLIPILSREQVFELVSEYNNHLQGMDPRIIELRMEFFSILFDNENILALNNLTSPQGNKMIQMLVDTFFVLNQVSSADKSGMLLDRGCRIIMQFFTKLDHDARLQSKRARQIVSRILMPFVDAMFSNKNNLKMIKNDGELAAITVSFLWLLRNMDSSSFVRWVNHQDIFSLTNLMNFLESAAATFFVCQAPRRTSESTRQGVAAVYHVISILIRKEALDSVKDKLRNLDPFMSQSFTNVSSDQQQIVQQQIELEEEFESTNTSQSPYVGVLLRRISKMLTNIGYFTCLHDDKELIHLFFNNCMRPFLNNYAHEIVVKELYQIQFDKNGKRKKAKIRAVEKRRIEQKWRWLMGCILANMELTRSDIVHPVITDCYDALSKPFKDILAEQTEQERVSQPVPPVTQESSPVQPSEEESQSNESSSDVTVQDDEIVIADGLVRAGSLDKLIERLIGAHSYVDSESSNFKKVFLLTFYSFTTPAELMIKIVQSYPTYSDKCQLNILNFLSEWVKNGFHDFDNITTSLTIDFLCSLGEDRNTTKQKLKKIVLKQLLESRMNTSSYYNRVDQDNAPRVPPNFDPELYKEPKIDFKIWRSLRKRTLPNPFDYAFDILEWPSVEIARQLTLIESEVFKKIEPKECFDLGWTRDGDKYDLSPNIVAVAERFNNFSFWIRNCIVNERDIKRRQALMLKFVDIAKELRDIKNYATMFQITSALNSAELNRLKLTRKALTEKHEEFLNEASSMLDNNYTSLRNELKYSAGLPTVPLQAVYLRDLMFIEEGNPNTITHKDKSLINLVKRRHYSSTISGIQLLQQSSNYTYQPLPYLQYILTEDLFTNLEFDEKILYQKSLQREARGK